MKKCVRCLKTKDLQSFGYLYFAIGQKNPTCKDCINTAMKKTRARKAKENKALVKVEL